MTLGSSQEEVCVPEVQLRALFEDAQLYYVCEEQIYKLDSLVGFYEDAVLAQDSLIINLNKQITLQDSVIQELDLDKKDPWYMKYLYILIGIGITQING